MMAVDYFLILPYLYGMSSVVTDHDRDQAQQNPIKMTDQYLAYFAGQEPPLQPTKLTDHAGPGGRAV
jgi:hypothetical protein